MQESRRFVFRSLVVIALFSTLLACSSGKQTETAVRSQDAEKNAGVRGGAASSPAGDERYSVEIAPADATRRSTLSLRPKGFGLSDARIEWLVDGMAVSGADAYTFGADTVEKGAVVQAKVAVKDKEIRSNQVVIKNSPPEITAGHFVLTGDNLAVDVTAGDADDDSVTVVYGWTVNGEPAGDGKVLEKRVKRGDKIEVRMVPSDGESEGRPVILKSEARNMAPVITEQTGVRLDGDVWSGRLKAEDYDGDEVTFTLKSGPPGMTIAPDTGLMTWEVPQNFKGNTSCIVVVKDDHGGETSYTVNIVIAEAGTKAAAPETGKEGQPNASETE